MTIYVMANGEGIDGLTTDTGGPLTLETTNVDTNYARVGYFSSYNNNPNGFFWEFGTNLSYVAVKFFVAQNFSGTTISQSFCSLYDGSNERLRFTLVHDSGLAGFKVRTASVNGGTVTTLFDTTIPFLLWTSGNGFNSGWFNVEVDYQTSGSIKIYTNNKLAANWTGNPIVGGSSTLSKLNIRTSRTASSWGELRTTGILVADTSLVRTYIVSLTPSAAGSTSGWTGAYTVVNETLGWDLTSNATTNTNDAISTWNVTDVSSIFNTSVVKSLTLYGWSMRGLSGPSKISPVIRTYSTNYVGSNYSNPLPGNYNWWKETWTVNPNTSNAFTISELNALEIGVKAIS